MYLLWLKTIFVCLAVRPSAESMFQFFRYIVASVFWCLLYFLCFNTINWFRYFVAGHVDVVAAAAIGLLLMFLLLFVSPES